MIIFENKISTASSYELTDYKGCNIIPAVSDVMFEVMFNNDGIGKKYTSYLLSLVFDMDYEYLYNNIEFMKSRLDKERYHEKGMTVDLICKIGNKYYNVELNNNRTSIGRMERNVYYGTSSYGGTLKSGDDYNYNHTVQVNLNNFAFDGVDEIRQDFMLKDEKGNILTDKIKIIQIYIPLIRKKWYDNDEDLTLLEKFLMIINEKDSEKLDSLVKENDFMDDYRKDAKEKSIDTEVVGLYNKELEDEMLMKASLKEEYNEGKKQGIEEGMQKGILTVAKKMRENDLDLETISNVTGLSIKELEKLSN